MNPLLSALLVVSAACRSTQAEPRMVFVQDAAASVSSTSGEGYTQLTVGGDAGDLLLVLRGERVTALLDGEVLPPERIRREGDKLAVLDADGGELYAVRVLDENAGLVYPYDATVISGRGPGGGFFGFTSGDDGMVWRRAAGERRKLIGVSTSPADAALRAQLDIEGDALVIESVTEYMPAQKAGMRPLDVVVAIEGTDGATTEHLREALAAKEPGETLTLSVRRQGQPLELSLVVEEPRETDGPGLWTFGTGGGVAGDAAEYLSLSRLLDDRQELDRQLVELTTALARVRDEQAVEAARGTVESARRVVELSEKQAELAAELARREALAAESEAGRMALLGDLGARTMVVPSWPGAAGASAEDSDRLKRLEERLARLEELLEKLAAGQSGGDSQSGEEAGGQP